MDYINAADFGIRPGQEIAKELTQLFSAVGKKEEQTVTFMPGTYYISSANCQKYMLYITNTVGDKEFNSQETPHLNPVPFYLNALENLTVDGHGAVFVIDGKVTNMVLDGCKNITIKNMEIRHLHPDMHELRVVKKTPFTIDYEMDADTQYQIEKGKLYFYGTDYRCAADTHALNAHWIGLIRKDTPQKLTRVRHPLFGVLGLRDLGQRRFRAVYSNTIRFRTGDRFSLFDVRRQFAGIFVNRCANICLENIRQRFNYSLAFVAQDSENLSLENVMFAPEKDSPRRLASVADFMQVCMCRGNFTVANSTFDGSGDDCLNVHGIHFKIIDKQRDGITVRFMHPQSHGFNPLRTGDRIAFINPKTLLEEGRTEILKSQLFNETDIRLVLRSTVGASVGGVIEDIDACPDVVFTGNRLTRIITRGLLLTTRGKVHIAHNHFISTSMSGILLSDDAKHWYESGMCTDVCIENNTFVSCGETPIRIKPENSVHQGAVHKNIHIKNNRFEKYKGYCVTAKSTDHLVLNGNSYHSKKHLKTTDCTNVYTE